jgi:DNA-binding transcriptional MocR family regulator
MILFRMDERSGVSKSRQIVEQIRNMISSGVLQAGERIPSSRKMADILQVHRSTVSSAYQDLWALGYLEMRSGAVPLVRERFPVVSGKGSSNESTIDWASFSSPSTEELWSDYSLARAMRPAGENLPGGTISFVPFRMDKRLFQVQLFRTCLTRSFREEGANLLSYGDVMGYGPLRETIASRMATHGMDLHSDEILVTNGAQHALDLVLRMMSASGRSVAIEVPGYSQMIPLLRHHGLEIVEIPMKDDGMDLDLLEETCRVKPPHLVYTMPNFQNPTGITTDQPHRERLLSLCSNYGMTILEDGFEEEMKYSGKVVMPIKSMDSENRVIYCGTFSKVLFPGLRIGWIGAHRDCINRLSALRRFGELSPPSLLQAALQRFCADGHYERHVSSMHRIYRRRMQTAQAAMQRHLPPEWVEWTKPCGGYLVWLSMSPTPKPVVWDDYFAQAEVGLSHGEEFFPGPPSRKHFRMSISCLDEDEIEEGVRRLGLALRQIYGHETAAS